jgi:hypothetical protein
MSCLLSNLKPAVAKVADDEPSREEEEEEKRNERATLASNGREHGKK